MWVDAFTTTPLQGNACAVVLDARGLGDDAMLAIAREINLSETSFVFPGDGDADVVVRYWMPVGEIPLAGHPTIATAHALRETGAMAGYCARYGIVRERAYDVMQGMHVHRPGRAHVEVGGEPPDAIGRITVAGPAVTVMCATMTLP